jgi:hypothetical protein
MKKEKSFFSMNKKLFPERGISARSESAISISLLFCISFSYYYFFCAGMFFHQENNSLFIFSTDYFRQFADKPGGLLNYAGNFLIQFYFSPFYGSLIFSILLLLNFMVLKNIAGVLNDGKTFPLLFILLPSCLLMLFQTRYDFHVYQILGFLIVLTWFRFTIATQKRFMHIILILLIPFLYYLVGSCTIIYLGLYILYNFLYQKGNLRYVFPASIIAISVVTFYVFKDLLFLQPVNLLIAFPLFLNESSRLTIFLILFSILIISLPLLFRSAGSIVRHKKLERFGSIVTILILFPLSIFIMLKNYDPVRASMMKFEGMVYKQDWDGVIRQHEELGSSNIVEQYYYNLALSEKGELCNRMFFGRQSYGSLALTLTRDNDQAFRAMYFYYAVGLTAEAHHLAYELMVQHAYRPESIKMLIKTELINGNFKIAERYINVLKKTIHYKKWVEKYERMLYKPELVTSDPELGEKIRLIPRKDFFIVTDDFGNLERLLKENPDNRIAFEYKMARLLLEKDLVEIGKEIKNFKKLGYTHFPRHIEEAIVSLVNITKEFPDLDGLSISSDTDHRFIAYFSDLKSFRGDRKLIEKGIKKAEKNTFWYYLQYELIKSDFFKKGADDNSIY